MICVCKINKIFICQYVTKPVGKILNMLFGITLSVFVKNVLKYVQFDRTEFIFYILFLMLT